MGGRRTLRRGAGLALAAAPGAAAVAAALADRLDLAVAALGLASVLALVALADGWRRAAAAERTGRAALRTARAERRAAAARQRRLRRRFAAGRQETARELARQGAQLAEWQRETAHELARLGSRLARGQRGQTGEVEALVQLFQDFRPRAPMPSAGSWALNPTDLLELLFVVGRARPRLVLELGSGTSSVWLGYALEEHGGRLVSVDHDREYAQRTRAHLRRHGLDPVVEVREAALRPLEVAGETFHWYEVDAFADLSDVDVLVVDGPPGTTGPQARYPALPVLGARLSAHATVVLDDADRADERDIRDRWLAAVPGLARGPEGVGHLAVLSYARPAGPGTG